MAGAWGNFLLQGWTGPFRHGDQVIRHRTTRLSSNRGVTLFELLVAILLLGMTAAMIYSVLNVSIAFFGKGDRQILALEQKQGFVDLLFEQVNSAWYDRQHRKVMISADGEMLKIFTRHPLLYRQSGVVLAVYRYNPDDKTLYYLEKRDFYNIDYNDEYIPDFEDMRYLLKTDRPISMTYDEESGQVTLTYGEKQYAFVPKCLNKQASP